MLRSKKTALVVGALLALSGCASSPKIVIPSYSAPLEYKRLSEIESGGESKAGSYLSLAIDPEVRGEKIKQERSLAPLLINSVKQGLTETNFITLLPIFDEAYVQLNMQVLGFEYRQQGGDLSADIQVSYSLVKGITEYMQKIYSANVTRHAEQAHLLPGKSQVLMDLTQEVSQQFIADIVPVKTHQLREFKGMPSELEYVLNYAKQGNYLSAIQDMEQYAGKKDYKFLFNLAVLYEAQGCEHNDLVSFKKAEQNYRKSMAQGGHEDQVVTATKAKFDNFFRLFKETQQQRKQNQQLNDELESTYGI